MVISFSKLLFVGFVISAIAEATSSCGVPIPRPPNGLAAVVFDNDTSVQIEVFDCTAESPEDGSRQCSSTRKLFSLAPSERADTQAAPYVTTVWKLVGAAPAGGQCMTIAPAVRNEMIVLKLSQAVSCAPYE